MKLQNQADGVKGQAGMRVDEVLIQQVRESTDGTDIHKAENLIGAYVSAIRHYDLTGDPGFLRIASEGERALRVLLVKSRIRRCVGSFWPENLRAA